MQAIFELQKKLKEAQQPKNKSDHRLNERNAVDIIRFLIQSQKLQLIYTQDGKEYLTHDQLKKEIIALIEQYSGRLELIDMPVHLGIGIEAIQATVEQLVAEKAGQLINDSFVTPQYEMKIVEDLATMVQDKGQVELSDLTNKYWLPLSFIKDAVNKNLELLPKGCQITGNQIVSSTFSDRQLCKVRGLTRAITRPTSINTLSQRFKLDELKLKTLAEQLIKSGEIQGKIAKGQYIPTSFTNLQLNTVQAVYRQNQYVELTLLDKLQVSTQPREFLQKTCPDIILLKSMAISETMYHNIESQISSIANNSSFGNLYDILPEFLQQQDDEIACLLQLLQADVRLMPDNIHVCSAKFLNKCLAWFKNVSESEASKLIRQGFTQIINSGDSSQTDTKIVNKKKGVKKIAEARNDVESKSEIDKIMCPIKNQQVQEILIQNKVQKELALTLATFLRDPIKLQYKNIFLETLETNSGKASAKMSANIEQIAEKRYQLLKYILKQTERLSQNEDRTIILSIHSSLCKNMGLTLFQEIIQLQAFHNEVCVEKTIAATLKQFQKHIREIFQILEIKLESRDLVGFMTHLSDEIKNLGCRLGKTGPLDKKVERQIKSDLLTQFKDAAETAIQNNSVDEMLKNTIHYYGVLQGCYTGLDQESEDWALKLAANLLETDQRQIVLRLMAEKLTMRTEQFVIEVKQLIQ